LPGLKRNRLFIYQLSQNQCNLIFQRYIVPVLSDEVVPYNNRSHKNHHSSYCYPDEVGNNADKVPDPVIQLEEKFVHVAVRRAVRPKFTFVFKDEFFNRIIV